MTMKCISVRQPWAWLIVKGLKDVENRTWRHFPRYRGPVLIHASITLDKDAFDIIQTIDARVGNHIEDTFGMECGQARGAIVGIADLVDATRLHGSLWALTGHVKLVFTRPAMFCKAIPWKGQLGLFDVPVTPELLRCIPKGRRPQ